MTRATLAIVAAAVMTPVAASAEPMVLTATQMDSVTAGARLPVININVVITTQIANAIAISFATCGICRGAPSAFSFANAFNQNVGGQVRR